MDSMASRMESGEGGVMDVPTFVQVSGGRTSGMLAHMLKGRPNHFFMFQNTGREKPQTYDFLHKMDKAYGLNLIWLEYFCPDPAGKATFKIVSYHTANRTGVPFSQLNAKRKAIPNKFKRFCSEELKVKTARRYIRSLGITKWNYMLGYRADENRTLRSDTMQASFAPLKEAGITARDVAEFWKTQPFDLKLPIMPSGKTFGGNCMGCFWHSEYQHAHLCRNNPEEVKWLIEEEKKHGHTFNDAYSFEEMSKFVADRPQFIFSEEDALCQETNGSCGV